MAAGPGECLPPPRPPRRQASEAQHVSEKKMCECGSIKKAEEEEEKEASQGEERNWVKAAAGDVFLVHLETQSTPTAFCLPRCLWFKCLARCMVESATFIDALRPCYGFEPLLGADVLFLLSFCLALSSPLQTIFLILSQSPPPPPSPLHMQTGLTTTVMSAHMIKWYTGTRRNSCGRWLGREAGG